MPELQIDVAVANRFISSLSKSLQALCHGCMDFDSGIEIVGYINVNIDSGSKVDYVLNEKVLKSTTNSMTFVSNSFLAKKEQQKQSRDEACSPIPQLSAISSYSRGSHLGPQHHRAGSQVSSHPQVPGGAQKRSWTDDWRISPKRHRIQNPQMAVQSFPDPNSQSLHPQAFPSSSSHSYSDSGFKQPQGSASVGTANSSLELQINIKKEALETDSQNTADQEHSADDQAHDSSNNETNNIQIKCDPDADLSDAGETALGESNSEATSETTDFKGTFLEPSSSEDAQTADERSRQQESDATLPVFDNSETDHADDQELADDANLGGGDDDDAGVSGTNDAAVEYDQAAEDGSYSQSAYEDAGEGGSDAGQLEVIEIDDEDEDVQAMFGDTQSHGIEDGSGRQPSIYQAPTLYSQYPFFPDQFFPYSCTICGKGFKSRGGLSFHMEAHKGRQFVCCVCDFKFKHKHHMKNHLINVHKLLVCPICCATFTQDQACELTPHILACKK